MSVNPDDYLHRLAESMTKTVVFTSRNIREALREILRSTDSILQSKDFRELREWWHSIIRKYGQHRCYAVFLLLPGDKEAITYLNEFGKELDLISGKECLVIAFGDTEFKGPKFSGKRWSTLIDEHVMEGISVEISKMFNVELIQFPCLLIFSDIRKPEHVVISLKDQGAENIAENLREIFFTISKATSQKQDPLHALSLLHKTQKFQRVGKSVVSEIKSFAGKTLDTVMEAFIQARFQ